MSYVYKFFKWIYSFVMGIVTGQNKKNSSFSSPIELTKEEIEFVLAKLRLSTYKGEEFEKFYNVWVKLSNKLEKD